MATKRASKTTKTAAEHEEAQREARIVAIHKERTEIFKKFYAIDKEITDARCTKQRPTAKADAMKQGIIRKDILKEILVSLDKELETLTKKKSEVSVPGVDPFAAMLKGALQ